MWWYTQNQNTLSRTFFGFRILPLSVTLSNIVSRLTLFIRNSAQSITLNNIVKRTITFLRAISNSIAVNNNILKKEFEPRLVNQSITVNNNQLDKISFLRLSNQPISVSNIINRLTFIKKSFTQSINLNNIVSRTAFIFKKTTQQISFSSFSIRIEGLIRTSQITITLNNVINRFYYGIRHFFSIITFTINTNTITNPPHISYNPSTDPDLSAFNRTWILVNVSSISPRPDSTQFSWNGLNGTFSNNAGNNYWSNKTSLADGNYTFWAWANDTTGQYNTTSTRTVTIVTTPPSVNLVVPASLGVYNNDTIFLNYTINAKTSTTCQYSVINESGLVISNTSIPGCANTTFILTKDGSYQIYLYATDLAGNIGSATNVFRLSTIGPAVNLNTPSDNNYSQGQNVNFSFTASDYNGINYCKLYSNFSGSWGVNETFNFVTSGIQASTLKNISDNSYIWNVNCTDTVGLNSFAMANRTVIVDTIPPVVNITNTNFTNITGYNYNLTYNISDNQNLSSCYFTLRNSTGFVHNYAENTSLNCSASSQTLTVLSPDTFSITVYGQDSAGNVNSSLVYFTAISPSSPGGGGAGAGTTNLVNVLVFDQTNLSKYYSDLDRGIAYSDYFLTCDKSYPQQTCNLKQNEFDTICADLTSKIGTNMGDCFNFYYLYLNDTTHNVQVSLDVADQYNLIRLIKGQRALFDVTPEIVDSLFVRTTNTDFSIDFLSSRQLSSCGSINNTGESYSFDCNLTSNTTAHMVLKETNYPVIKTYTGVISFYDSSHNVVYKNVRVRLINMLGKSSFTFNLALYQAILFLYIPFLALLLYVIISPRLKVRLNTKAINNLKNIVILKKK